MKHILILGAGFGGLTSANEFLKHKVDANITVIDKKQEYCMGLTNLWVMIGKGTPDKYRHKFDLLNKNGINFINDEIKKIDSENKIVTTLKKQFNYDYLIVALGADLEPESTPGFNESAFNLYEMDGAYAIHNEIKKFRSGKIILLICKPPYKCPAAPYETLFLLDDYFTKRELRDNVILEICTPEPQPMPTAGKKVGDEIIKILDEKNIKYNFNHKVMDIDPENKKIIFENGIMEYDLLIGIPSHASPKVLKDSGLTDESGWISVDKKTLKAKFESVYAIGDNAAIKLANGNNLPKAGVFAEEQAKIVVQNIINEINSKKEKSEFEGKGGCFVELSTKTGTMVEGNFFAEPTPIVEIKQPSAEYSKGKENFEKERIKEWF